MNKSKQQKHTHTHTHTFRKKEREEEREEKSKNREINISIGVKYSLLHVQKEIINLCVHNIKLHYTIVLNINIIKKTKREKEVK